MTRIAKKRSVKRSNVDSTGAIPVQTANHRKLSQASHATRTVSRDPKGKMASFYTFLVKTHLFNALAVPTQRLHAVQGTYFFAWCQKSSRATELQKNIVELFGVRLVVGQVKWF